MLTNQKVNGPKRFPEANHQPRQKAMDRKIRAQARQEVYNELTLEQKIALLPPEPFSKKQRARLMALLEKKNAPKVTPEAPKSEEKQAAK